MKSQRSEFRDNEVHVEDIVEDIHITETKNIKIVLHTSKKSIEVSSQRKRKSKRKKKRKRKMKAKNSTNKDESIKNEIPIVLNKLDW